MATEFHIPNNADITFKTTLNNQSDFLIKLRWNDSTASWYFALDTVEEYTNSYGEVTNQVQGFERIVINKPLIRTNQEKLPDGNFYVAPAINPKDEVLDRYNLGSGKAYRFYFVEYSEIQ